jgi:hypothetical protein
MIFSSRATLFNLGKLIATGGTMKEILVIANNDVGSLAQVTEALGSTGVNIEAISAYGSEGKAVFRIITGDSAIAG